MSTAPTTSAPTQPPEAPPLALPAAMLAQILGGQLVGKGDVILTNVVGIEDAGPTDLTFIRSAKFAGMWAKSRAGAALVTKGVEVPGHDPTTRAIIYVASADLAMIKLLELAHARLPRSQPKVGVHPTAIIDPSAKIAPTACIGPFCIVGAGSVIGERTTLQARVTIGLGVQIAEDGMFHPGVVIYDRTIIGKRCTIHANTVIGADGFGYIADFAGFDGSEGARPGEHGAHIKVPHIGIVEISDDVDIGAGSCIDRGKLGATKIGAGTKIDNLVQIAHNCNIGKGCLICGLTGLAGSVTIGDRAILAGQCGVCDNLTVGSGATLTAQAGAMADVPPGEVYSGFPAQPHRQQMRGQAILRKLPELVREVKSIRKAVGGESPKPR